MEQTLTIPQYQLPEQLTNKYTVTVGNYNIWFYGWFALVVALSALIVIAVIVLIVRAIIHKRDTSDTKVEHQKKQKQKQAEAKAKAETEKRDIVHETLEAAPPLTAFTAAEYPGGIDPMMWMAEEGISDAEHEKRVQIYHMWCDQQKQLYDKQINERRQYFAQNDFGFKIQQVEEQKLGKKNNEMMTPAERKRLEKIEKDNAKRIERAKKLKAKGEAEEKKAARKAQKNNRKRK